MYGYIYKTTNLVNNKVYIGQHKDKFTSRCLGHGIIINRAIRKEGRKNFNVIPLVYAISKPELNRLEIYYIAYYRELLGWDMVYNIAHGGYESSGLLRKHTSEELNKMNRNHKDFSGKNNPMFGKKHSKEANEKRRQSLMGHSVSDATRLKQSRIKLGKNTWNKGLTKETDLRMKKLSESVKETLRLKQQLCLN